MTTKTDRTATYKGVTYRLLYLGNTKYGRRAHLEYTNGTKDFWVNADTVTETTGGSSSGYTPKAGRRTRSDDDRCELCDENKYACGHCIGW